MNCRTFVNLAALNLALLFSSLPAFAGTPVTTNALPLESFAGEEVCFDSVFSNTSDDVGFGPYLRLDLPSEITLNSATFLGTSVPITTIGTFPPAPGSQLTDTRSNSTVTSSAGNSLHLLVLPLGSVVKNGPELTTNICITIAPSVTIGSPIDVKLQGVFEFGDTATGINGYIEGASVTKSITPTLYLFSSNQSATASKNVPGPSFPTTFTDTIDVANGITVHDFNITNTLAPELQFIGGSDNVSGGNGAAINSTPSTVTPGGAIATTLTNISGMSGNDVSINYNAYITDILDEATCDIQPINNTANSNAEYPNNNSLPLQVSTTSHQAKHLIINQSISNGAAKPGDTLTVVNQIALTEFGTANALQVTDIIPDGMTFDSHSAMTLNGGNVTIVPTVTVNGDGTTQVQYDIHAVTGNISPASQINISYSISVDQTFNDAAPVLAADNLTLATNAEFSLTAGALACNDTSSAQVDILPVNNSLTIVNPQTDYAPGDIVTFRHELQISSGDTADIIFETFLPLPVFDVSQINLSFGNDITFAPTDTVAANPTSITIDAATNKLTLAFPDLTNTNAQTIAVDIDVEVVDEPFKDNLFLTTLFLASTQNTQASAALGTQASQMNVRAPELVITHGVSATTGDGSITAISNPVNSNIIDLDAGDEVTFIITVENIGGASAHDVRVTAPNVAGLTGATLVSVTDGGGTPIAHTNDLFNAGLDITPSLAKNDGTVGAPFSQDSLIITYTAIVADSAKTHQTITTNANVDWTSSSGATRFTAETDDTTLTMANANISVSINSISPNAGGSNIVVGDTVTYQAIVTLPEGTTPSLTSSIALPSGFEYVAASLSVDTTGFVGTVDTSPTVTLSGTIDSGQTLAVLFDSPVNTLVTSDNNSANNAFAFTFDALVTDSSALDGLPSVQNRTLSSSIDYQDNTSSLNDTAITSFSEHDLSVTASFSPATGLSAGDTVTVTMTVNNTGTAPAYDIELTDTLNSDLFDLTSVNAVTTPAGYSFIYTSPTVSYTANNNVTLAAGASETFVYSADVKSGVVSGSTYTNTPQVSGDSQEGSLTTERDSSDNASASGAVSSLAISNFAVINSSESWTNTAPTVNAAIGEVLTYQLTIAVPEALHKETAAKDFVEITLPEGTEYLSGTANIMANATNITSTNYGMGASLPTSSSAITPNLSTNLLGFDLGDIDNQNNSGSVETIVITFDVLVKNSDNNNRSNIKSLTADVHYNNFAGNPQAISQNSTYTIVEAALSVTKNASPASVTGGDEVTFTAVITNNSTANATRGWDLTTTDILPSDLENISLTSAVLSRGSQDISSCFTISGQSLTSDMSCLTATNRYLDVGETITVIYTADVDISVNFEQQITNTFSAQNTSLPGLRGTANAAPGAADSDQGERTGSNNTNTSGDAVNDLIASDSATIVSGKPTIALTSDASHLQILDTTSINATIAVPVGTTDNFIVTYDLPAGLAYTGAAAVINLPDSNFTTSLTPTTTFAANTDPLVFDFGTIVNSANTSQEITISVEVSARNTLPNQNNENLITNVALDYAGVTSPKPSSNITIVVIEPNITLTKTITAGATGSDAGDTISYQLVLRNTATQGVAYRVDFNDVLPEKLLGAPDGSGGGTNISNIVLANSSDKAVLTGTMTPLQSSDASITTTTLSNDTLHWPLFDMPPLSQLTISYDVVVSNSANSGDSLTNSATASFNSLLSGAGRDNSDIDNNASDINNYQVNTTNSLTIDSSIAVQQSLTPGQADSNFAIGEQVSFDIRIDLIEGMTENLSLSNILPEGLSYISSTIVAASHISYTGSGVGTESPTDTISFSLGDITNIADADPANDFFIIRLVAQVENISSNTNSVVRKNSASVSSSSSSAGPDLESITIVEPNMTLVITPNTANATLGDKVTFTATLAHTSSTADAFENQLNILIPSGLTYVNGSHTGDGSLNDSVSNNLAIDLGTISLAEGSKSFTFDTIIDNDAAVNNALVIASANGAYSSLAGDVTGERDYTFSASTSVTPTITSTLDVAHAAQIVIDNGETGLLEPGDTLEYTITITNKGLAASNVVYSEDIPNFTSYILASASASFGSIDDSNINSLVFNIGTLNTNDVVTLTYRVTINAGVSSGTQIRAQGSVDSDITVPELSDTDNNDSNGDQPTINVVQDAAERLASLYVQQTAKWIVDADMNSVISPTDTIELTYFIKNIAGSTLTNVAVSEVLPTGVTYVPASATIAGANSINVVGQNTNVTIASLLPGELLIARYSVTIDNPLFNSDADTTSELFTHVALADSDQTTQIQSDSNGIVDDGIQPITYTAISSGTGQPDINVYLDWTLVTDNDNDGLVDPNDQVMYQFTVVNSGSAVATGSQLQNTLPINTTLLTNSGFTSQGIISTESPFFINIGDIAPGDVINAGFIVSINSDTANNTVIANQGTVSGSNFTDVLSDDNAIEADGLNPTLLTVSTDTNATSAQPSFSMNLVSSSNNTTAGTNFIQGEELALEITVSVPAGTTEDLSIQFELPNGLLLVNNTAQLKRIFDTGLNAALNPSNINTTSEDTFVSASSELTGSGPTYQLALGTIINSDNDNNDEQFVFRFTVEDNNLVPTVASQAYPVSANIGFVSSANENIQQPNENIALNLLNRVPVAVNDIYNAINEDSLNNTLNILVNDFDLDAGQTLAITSTANVSALANVQINAGSILYSPAPNFNGADTFDYTITDSAGAQSSTTVTVNVTAINDDPVAVNDNTSTNEDVAISITPLTNDTDVDGDTLTLTSATATTGNINIVNNVITYTPAPNFTGNVTITYCISDSNGGTDCGSIIVNVIPVNDAPVASNDTLTINEDEVTTITPLLNDSDIDGDSLTVTSATALHGNVTINSNGTLTYTPTAHYNGIETISYCISDGQGGVDCATITITITPINDAPIASNDSITTNEDTPVSITPLVNDSDVDGDTLTLTTSTASNGSIAVVNNTITYTPPANFTGVATINYCISDGNGGNDCATISVTVSPVNDAPVANNDSLTITEDQVSTLSPLDNDTDIDGDALSITSATATNGTVVVNDNGTITYTPNQDFNGVDTISYCISDPTGATSCATITINVSPVNDAPIANDDTVTTPEDTSVAVTPLINDTDVDGDTLSVTSATAQNGTVTIENNTITYTPNLNFNGVDEITYCINDGNGGVDCAIITINVTPVNDAPIAVPDEITIAEGQTTVITPLINDIDEDGETLTISSASAAQGTVVINDDGSVTYTPPIDYVGEDIISYCVVDATGASSCSTITITVTPVNDAPVANDDSATTPEDTPLTISPLDNDIDVDGDALSIVSATAEHGNVTINSNGDLIYTPNENFVGTDTLTYCITDPVGSESCATITINVTPVNDAPEALNDVVRILVDEIIDINALINDSDIDEDEIRITSVSTEQGTATINPDGTVHFTPPLGFFGEITITYQISEVDTDMPLTDTAEILVIVDEPQVIGILPPEAIDDNYTATNWAPISLDVLTNDSDPQGQQLRLISASTDVGTVEVNDDMLTFSPIEGLIGNVSLQYVIANEQGLTDIANVTVTFDVSDAALFPTITIPADLCDGLTVNASALYTRVDVGEATALDRFGNPLPVSVVNNNLLFPPGINSVYWQATDEEGRTTTEVQNVCVKPLVSLDRNQVAIENETVTVGVYLNGQSEQYPMTINYTLSGTTTETDYEITSGEIVIEEGTDTEISVNILPDTLTEADETLIFTLDPALNRGAQFEHVITITERNIAPKVRLDASQQSQARLTVTQSGGNVVITSSVYDPNTTDSFSYVWNASIDNLSGAESKFIFDPSSLETGVYPIEVNVTDSGEPALSDSAVIYIHVVASLATLTNEDSDGDLIPDNVEGYRDVDRDGIPDYLDRVMECNVLHEDSSIQNQFLVEGDPGVCIRRGEFTFISENNGALLLDEGSEISGAIVEDTQAVNVGGMMNFIAYGLPETNTSYRIAIPQRKPIPQEAVYRKFRQDTGWGDFIEDSDNSLWSTRGEPGYCPPTGSSLWQPGLNTGDWCVQLIIKDGGANDDDNSINGTIIDPGYVGTLLSSNALPVAVDDSLTLPFNTERTVDVLINDTDPEGETLTIISATANFGSVTIIDEQIVYTAPNNMVGKDTIHYGISNTSGATDYAIVDVTILPNNPPEPENDAVEIIQDQAVDIVVLSNDTDPDGDTLTVISAIADNGQVHIDENGVLTYTPNQGFFGTDTIYYVVQDTYGATAPAIVTVTVIQLFEIESKTESSGGSANTWLLALLLVIAMVRLITARTIQLSLKRRLLLPANLRLKK